MLHCWFFCKAYSSLSQALRNSQVQTTADVLLHANSTDNMSMTTLFFLDSAGLPDLPIRSDPSHAVASTAQPTCGMVCPCAHARALPHALRPPPAGAGACEALPAAAAWRSRLFSAHPTTQAPAALNCQASARALLWSCLLVSKQQARGTAEEDFM